MLCDYTPSVITDLTFTLLGSGTSAGVPIIGCDCAVCTSDDPRDSRLRTAACLRFVDAAGRARTILIDASPDLRAQALRHDLRHCDTILFTHNHVDHTFGLDETRRFNVAMDGPIEVLAEPHTLEHLGRVYKHIFERDKNINDSFVARLTPGEVAIHQPIDRFGLRFTPLRMLHGRLPVAAYRIEALDERGDVASVQPPPLPLAYCTDVSAIPPETWPRLTQLDTLFLDMLRYRTHPTHFTVDQAVNAAHEIGARRTFFIHMTHDILHADLDAKLPDGMNLGYDGLTLGAS